MKTNTLMIENNANDAPRTSAHPTLAHLTALISLFSLSGCIMYSIWEYDFSSMEENPISDLVKNTTPLEASMKLKHLVDEEKLTEKANFLFLGKNESDLRRIFSGKGDKCDYLTSGVSETKIVTCQAQRWWNFKNVGYPYFGLVKDISKKLFG